MGTRSLPRVTTAPRHAAAIVHDYLTQHGGAERVVLAMARAFPGAPIYTSFYAPDETFPDFAELDIRTQPINRVGPLRRQHRVALPLLAASFSATTVDAEVALCSSSGWAHGVHCTGSKIVYCHTPARWLYQQARYLGEAPGRVAHAALLGLGPPLRRWDRRAAATCQRYLVNSTAVQHRVRSIYGIDAEVIPPPPALGNAHPQEAVGGVLPGFWLCVSRLLPYKNVDAVVAAFAELSDERLLVVGSGPEETAVRSGAAANVSFAGRLNDDQLTWCYANCRGVVAASHEDFGLTPLEGAAFGRPAVVLSWGGFLDTVVDGSTGIFFKSADPPAIAAALRQAGKVDWSAADIVAHAQRFSTDRFAARLQQIVEEVRSAR